MLVWTTLTDSEIYDVADVVGVALADRGSVNSHRQPLEYRGRARTFGLRPTAEKDEYGDHRYQRVSASAFHPERRVFAVCWHGHRDFLRELFTRDPNARVKTAIADYRGADGFERVYPDTAWRNVGSMMFPRTMAEVCNCHEAGY